MTAADERVSRDTRQMAYVNQSRYVFNLQFMHSCNTCSLQCAHEWLRAQLRMKTRNRFQKPHTIWERQHRFWKITTHLGTHTHTLLPQSLSVLDRSGPQPAHCAPAQTRTALEASRARRTCAAQMSHTHCSDRAPSHVVHEKRALHVRHTRPACAPHARRAHTAHAVRSPHARRTRTARAPHAPCAPNVRVARRTRAPPYTYGSPLS